MEEEKERRKKVEDKTQFHMMTRGGGAGEREC